nr:MAG TPA: hypothetical protein [Caudoviricetes sp.]
MANATTNQKICSSKSIFFFMSSLLLFDSHSQLPTNCVALGRHIAWWYKRVL